MPDQQKLPESKINEALSMAAVDACAMLRKWSDSVVATGKDDTAITPHKIGLFQRELTQHLRKP